MSIMANNLESMIQKSGMAKKEVAALKGITPETLSRQIHGKIQMTLQDAERYAKILDCSAQDVLFPLPPTQLLGMCSINKGGRIKRDVSHKSFGDVYSRFHDPKKIAFISWDISDEYTGVWQYLQNGLEAVFIDPIKNKYVHNDAKGFECYAMTEEPYEYHGNQTRIAAGMLYPEPGNRYTIHNGDQLHTLRNQKLVWATPVLGMILRPDLRGFDIRLNK